MKNSRLWFLACATLVAMAAVGVHAGAQTPAARRAKAAVDVCLDLRGHREPTTPDEQERAVARARERVHSGLQRLAPASANLEVRYHTGSSCVTAIVEGSDPRDAMSVCTRLVTQYQEEGPSLPLLDPNGGRTSAVSVTEPCHAFTP